MEPATITNIILIAVPSFSGLIFLCYQKPNKAIILLKSIRNGLAILFFAVIVIGWSYWWGLHTIERDVLNIQPLDTKKIDMANKIMDNTSTNMNAITFFSVIVPVLCWVLIQLAIFFKPEATKKKETIENENPNTV